MQELCVCVCVHWFDTRASWSTRPVKCWLQSNFLTEWGVYGDIGSKWAEQMLPRCDRGGGGGGGRAGAERMDSKNQHAHTDGFVHISSAFRNSPPSPLPPVFHALLLSSLQLSCVPPLQLWCKDRMPEAAWNRLLHALGLECVTPRSPSRPLPFLPSSHLFFPQLLMQPLITADMILQSYPLLYHLHPTHHVLLHSDPLFHATQVKRVQTDRKSCV